MANCSTAFVRAISIDSSVRNAIRQAAFAETELTVYGVQGIDTLEAY
jgi:hypothetical protein